jgi:hypothetical protein
MPETIANLPALLIELDLASADTIWPCTLEEIVEVQASHPVALPPEYEQFLALMGRRAGDLLRGTDFYYPGILGLANAGRELLRDNDALHLLPEGSVILGMHQGYELYWLEKPGAVRWYKEGHRGVFSSWPSLPAFLSSQARAQAQVRRARTTGDREPGLGGPARG